MFSNFYRIDLHNKTCVTLSNLCRSIGRNQIENRTSLDFVMVFESARLFIAQLNTHVFVAVFIIECRFVVNTI